MVVSVEAAIMAAVALATSCGTVPATLSFKTKPPGKNISPEAFVLIIKRFITPPGTNDCEKETQWKSKYTIIIEIRNIQLIFPS